MRLHSFLILPCKVVGEYSWEVHIPSLIEGQTIDQLSMVLYDARTKTMMSCADLEEDRYPARFWTEVVLLSDAMAGSH